MAVFVGVDVSKQTLAFAEGSEAPVRQVPNDRRGIAQLARRLRELQPAGIAVESTGGYERALVQALAEAGLPVAVVNPLRVRRFGEGLGLLAKTDPLDARLLARFAATVELRLVPIRQGAQRRRADLVARRRQLVAMLAAEKNRLHLARREVRADIKSVIAVLVRRIQRLDARIDALLREDPERQAVGELLRTTPGVGPTVTRTLLVDLPELGALSRREIASLVGVAPFPRDSGKKRGQRWVRGGRASVRTVLYLAAMIGSRCNPVLRALYQRLRAAGKPPKLAFVALARKLLTILNGMVRNHTAWREIHA